MTEYEAQALARQVEGEPGWHAEPHHNLWTSEWTVRAWQGETEEDQENSYTLRFRADWYKLRTALLEEQPEAGVEH